MAAAASAAVFVPSGNVRTSMSRPRSRAAVVKRRAFGCRSGTVGQGRCSPDGGGRSMMEAMADAALEDLPLYMSEPPTPPPRPASLSWAVVAPSNGRAIRNSLVMTRIVPLVPSVAVDALMAWWRGRDGGPVPYRRSHFELATPTVPDDGCDHCRMGVRFHRYLQWRDTPLEVELTPWSSAFTELDLRPLRWTVSPSESYFAAGHTFLDMLERAMVGQAERRPVLNRRIGSGTASLGRRPPWPAWR